jgi:hypothetical protein
VTAMMSAVHDRDLTPQILTHCGDKPVIAQKQANTSAPCFSLPPARPRPPRFRRGVAMLTSLRQDSPVLPACAPPEQARASPQLMQSNTIGATAHTDPTALHTSSPTLPLELPPSGKYNATGPALVHPRSRGARMLSQNLTAQATFSASSPIAQVLQSAVRAAVTGSAVPCAQHTTPDTAATGLGAAATGESAPSDVMTVAQRPCDSPGEPPGLGADASSTTVFGSVSPPTLVTRSPVRKESQNMPELCVPVDTTRHTHALPQAQCSPQVACSPVRCVAERKRLCVERRSCSPCTDQRVNAAPLDAMSVEPESGTDLSCCASPPSLGMLAHSNSPHTSISQAPVEPATFGEATLAQVSEAPKRSQGCHEASPPAQVDTEQPNVVFRDPPDAAAATADDGCCTALRPSFDLSACAALASVTLEAPRSADRPNREQPLVQTVLPAGLASPVPSNATSAKNTGAALERQRQAVSMHADSCAPLLNEASTSMRADSCAPLLNEANTSMHADSCAPLLNEANTSMHADSCAPLLNEANTSMHADSCAALPGDDAGTSPGLGHAKRRIASDGAMHAKPPVLRDDSMHTDQRCGMPESASTQRHESIEAAEHTLLTAECARADGLTNDNQGADCRALAESAENVALCVDHEVVAEGKGEGIPGTDFGTLPKRAANDSLVVDNEMHGEADQNSVPGSDCQVAEGVGTDAPGVVHETLAEGDKDSTPGSEADSVTDRTEDIALRVDHEMAAEGDQNSSPSIECSWLAAGTESDAPGREHELEVEGRKNDGRGAESEAVAQATESEGPGFEHEMVTKGDLISSPEADRGVLTERRENDARGAEHAIVGEADRSSLPSTDCDAVAERTETDVSGDDLQMVAECYASDVQGTDGVALAKRAENDAPGVDHEMLAENDPNSAPGAHCESPERGVTCLASSTSHVAALAEMESLPLETALPGDAAVVPCGVPPASKLEGASRAAKDAVRPATKSAGEAPASEAACAFARQELGSPLHRDGNCVLTEAPGVARHAVAASAPQQTSSDAEAAAPRQTSLEAPAAAPRQTKSEAPAAEFRVAHAAHGLPADEVADADATAPQSGEHPLERSNAARCPSACPDLSKPQVSGNNAPDETEVSCPDTTSAPEARGVQAVSIQAEATQAVPTEAEVVTAVPTQAGGGQTIAIDAETGQVAPTGASVEATHETPDMVAAPAPKRAHLRDSWCLHTSTGAVGAISEPPEADVCGRATEVCSTPPLQRLSPSPPSPAAAAAEAADNTPPSTPPCRCPFPGLSGEIDDSPRSLREVSFPGALTVQNDEDFGGSPIQQSLQCDNGGQECVLQPVDAGQTHDWLSRLPDGALHAEDPFLGSPSERCDASDLGRCKGSANDTQDIAPSVSCSRSLRTLLDDSAWPASPSFCFPGGSENSGSTACMSPCNSSRLYLSPPFHLSPDAQHQGTSDHLKHLLLDSPPCHQKPPLRLPSLSPLKRTNMSPMRSAAAHAGSGGKWHVPAMFMSSSPQLPMSGARISPNAAESLPEARPFGQVCSNALTSTQQSGMSQVRTFRGILSLRDACLTLWWWYVACACDIHVELSVATDVGSAHIA